MEESYKSLKPLNDEIFSPETSPVKRFVRLAEFVYESQSQAAVKYGKVCGCPCASLGSDMAGQEAGIRAKFEDITRRFERY
jgi:TetR/AcrR family transcriptional regulator, transcriptional repressor for nem operon